MTDISGLFKIDDAVFDFELKGKNPETGEPVDTGVTFSVRSLRNPDAAAIVKKVRSGMFGRKMVDNIMPEAEEIGALMLMDTTDPTDEQLATCVTGWEWGDKTLGDVNIKYSPANVLTVIKSFPWIREQVLHKALSITDFTKA